MLRLNLILFFVVLSGFIYGQPKLSEDFIVTNSEPFGVVDAPSKLYFSDGSGFSYSIKTDDEIVTVQKFDVNEMKEVGRNVYEDLPPYNRAIDILQIGEKFYYLYESFNKKTDQKSVHVREVIISDCSLGEERTLFTTEGDVANGAPSEELGFYGMAGGPPFAIYKSYDESKIMINYRRKPISKNDAVNHDLLGFFVFNSSLELISGREVKMPYTEKVMNNLAFTVGTNGVSYMILYHRDENNFQLLAVPEKGDISVKPIESQDFVFKKLYMKETEDGNLGFLGFYANGVEYKFWEGTVGSMSFNTNGIRYFELSKEGAILNESNIEFPIELINMYESNRQQDKNEDREEDGVAGIRDLRLRHFEIDSSGNVFILGEQYYYSQSFNFQTKSMQYQIHYEDLLATKINSKGEVVWMKKLPKRQFGVAGRNGMGVAYLKGNDSHYILFLDNVKNADIAIDEVPAKHVDGKGGYLTAYKINDASGEYSKHTLYNSVEVNDVKTYQFKTSRILQALSNTLLVEVYVKGKKDMMIKMELVE